MIAQFRAPAIPEAAPEIADPPALAHRWRNRRWLVAGVAAVLLIGLGLAVAAALSTPRPAAPAAPPVATAPRLTAHGQVNPIRRARVGTLTGGVLASLAVEIG